jgi:hypothetical protein
MNISNPIPISLPVTVANLPTEAVETQNRIAQRVPESRQTLENSRNREAQSNQQLNDAERSAKNAEIRDRILGTGEDATNQQQGNSRNSAATGKQQANASEGESTSTNSNKLESETTNKSDPALEAKEQRQAAQDTATVRELAAIDRKVRAHEQAHASVGGVYAGAPSFTYQTGPNGVRYAVGGEVSIDISSVPGNPEATLRKAEQVRRAALAPADPSPTDRQVAATAQAIATKARFEIARIRSEQSENQQQVTINGEQEQEQFEIETSSTSFSGTRLFAALETDATEAVGGQVNASA